MSRSNKVKYVTGFVKPSSLDVVEARGSFPFQRRRSRVQHADLDIENYYHNKDHDGGIWWNDLPLPMDSEAWLAKYVEMGQGVTEYASSISRPTSESPTSTIFLLPIIEALNHDSINGAVWPASAPCLKSLADWTSAFYDRPVVILLPSHIYRNDDIHDSCLSSDDRFILELPTGETHTVAGRVSPNGKRQQAYVGCLLHILAKIKNRRFNYGDDLSGAISLVGITMSDLYSHDTDLFVAGFAGQSRVACLSCHRYHPCIKMDYGDWYDYGYTKELSDFPYFKDGEERPLVNELPLPTNDDASSKVELFRRAGRLLIHELGHVYGLEHCIHHHCLMNGSGHLLEDFITPAYICGICLRKLQCRIRFDVKNRYFRLHKVFVENGMEAEMAYSHRRLAYFNTFCRPEECVVVGPSPMAIAGAAGVSAVSSSSVSHANDSSQHAKRKSNSLRSLDAVKLSDKKLKLSLDARAAVGDEALSMCKALLDDRGHAVMCSFAAEPTAADWDALVDCMVGTALSSCPKFVRGTDKLMLPSSRVSKFILQKCDGKGSISFPKLLFLFAPLLNPQQWHYAINAGLFVFGQATLPYVGDTIDASDRGIISLELAGEGIDPCSDVDNGGRIILTDIDQLTVGKKSTKAVCNAEGYVPADQVSVPFKLEMSTDSNVGERVWSECVKQHGADWMGFSSVEDLYKSTWTSGGCSTVQLVSILLIDETNDIMASAEIGVLIGSAYSCISHCSKKDQYPRADRIRSNAAILRLAEAGVRLFDVGTTAQVSLVTCSCASNIHVDMAAILYLQCSSTTAQYYIDLSGYHRASRKVFVDCWRKYRDTPLAQEELLSEPCRQIRKMLEDHRNKQLK